MAVSQSRACHNKREANTLRFLRYGRNDVMSMIFCVLFSIPVAAQESRHHNETTGPLDVKILNVNDEISNELWNTTIGIVDHEGNHKEVAFSDYKDEKILILDFWATWCSPCIKDLPTLLALDKEITCKVIPLSDEPISKVSTFLANNREFQKSDFFVYKRGSVLDKSFERSSIPHTIVIVDGKIEAITLPYLINASKLKKLITEGINVIPQKVELKKSDVSLLSLANFPIDSLDVKYSMLLPHIDGVTPGFDWEANHGDRGARLRIANYSLLSMLAIATGRGELFLWNPNRVSVKTSDNVLSIDEDQWAAMKGSVFCYEGTYTSGTTRNQAKYKLRSALNDRLGLIFEIDTVPTKIVTLSREYRHNQIATAYKYDAAQLVYYMNRFPVGYTLEVSEKLGNETVYLPIEIEQMERKTIEELLLKQGWSMHTETQNAEQLVVSWSDLLKRGEVL